MDVELLAGLISEVDPSIGEKDLRPYRSPLNKYAARVFDSLAEILISEPSGEVVAVGIQRDERKVIFTVAINQDMMPAHMHDHLITLWGLLKEISDGYHQDRVKYMRPSHINTELFSLPEETQQKIYRFMLLIYQYSSKVFQHRINKHAKNNETRLQAFRRVVLSLDPEHEATPELCELCKYLWRINEYLGSGYTSSFCAVTKEYRVLCCVFSLLPHQVETVLQSSEQLIEEMGHSLGFPLVQYLKKVASLPTAVGRLLDIAYSQRDRPRFLTDKDIEIRHVSRVGEIILSHPDQWEKVALAALERMRKTLESSDPKPAASNHLRQQSFKAQVHCELSLVLHFLSKDVEDTSPPLPYIGLSKPPCSVCWNFFYKLWGRRPWLFFTRTTNGKTPFSWNFPDSELARSLYRRSFATIYQKLHADLADRYAKYILSRRPRHFMSQETFQEYYWELFGELPKVMPRTEYNV